MRLRRTLLAVPMLATGCGSHEHVVAWRDLPPPSARFSRAQLPPIPRGAVPCAEAHVRLTAAGNQPVNSATTVYYFGVRNVGRRTCALAARPAVTVLSTGGRGLRLHDIPAFGGSVPGGRDFGLRPRAQAGMTLFVSSPCREPGLRVSRARVSLDIGGRNRVLASFVTCKYGVDIGVGPFEPPEPPEVANPAPPRLRAEILGHPHARRGTTLVYRVRLRNVSRHAFRFASCPTVHESIGRQNGPVFGLDCRAAGTIRPHASVSFVMHYELSPHYVPGTRTLHWIARDEPNGAPVGTKATITVDP